MKFRIDAGTDVAMIGIWDASRNDAVLKKKWGGEFGRELENDTVNGHLFYVATGADCGGLIDVYIDTEVPVEVQKQMGRKGDDYLISAPTGKL